MVRLRAGPQSFPEEFECLLYRDAGAQEAVCPRWVREANSLGASLYASIGPSSDTDILIITSSDPPEAWSEKGIS